MRKDILIVLGSVIILVSCVGDIQDIPPQFQSDPAFSGRMSIDGAAFELQAGKDGYVMKSSHYTDSTAGLIFKSSIEPEVCAAACGPRIWFEFRAIDPVSQAPQAVENTIQLGMKEYSKEQTVQDSFDITFSAITEEAGGSFVFWEGLANGLVPGTNYSLTTSGNEVISACLHSISTDSCFGIKCIQLTPSESPDGCNVNLKAFRVNEQYILLEAVPEGVEPFTYQWTTSETTKKILLPLPVSGQSVVDLEVTDATGCVSFIQQKLNSSAAGVHACPIDYNFELELVPASLLAQPGTVIIFYEDENGLLYSSIYGSQTPASFFEILSVEEYEMTPQGDLSKKIDLRLKADLFQDMNDKPVRLEMGEFTIAVAY